jgi:signal transduction histidine kinase
VDDEVLPDAGTVEGSTLPGVDSRGEAAIDYAVIDTKGTLLAATRRGISEDVNAAVKHGDTIVDVESGGEVVGKIFFYNVAASEWLVYKQRLQTGSVVTLILIAVLMSIFILILYRRILKPFRTLQRFASNIAAGDLDAPLSMDKGNAFGAFTESFDLMRTELNAARENERRANQSKKELVASLSHDVRTPVASIKAISELMLAQAQNAGADDETVNTESNGSGNKTSCMTGDAAGDKTSCMTGGIVSNDTGLIVSSEKADASGKFLDNEKICQQLRMIDAKADQIDLLITNMFHATLEELEELKVTPAELSSDLLAGMIADADYRHLVGSSPVSVPECLVLADPIRLAQVFDNIIGNSYKYADTNIRVEASLQGDHLTLSFTDSGNGVVPDELPLLSQKFYRGSNAEEKSGSGLGLYISAFFMQEMKGTLICANTPEGFSVKIGLSLV